MSDVAMLWHIGFEELFSFFYLPNAQPGGFVDLMLKKNWHCLKIPPYFAALQIDN
jgi:hypothetical protein